MPKQDLPPFNLPPSFFAQQLDGIAADTIDSQLQRLKTGLAPNQGFTLRPTPYPHFLAAVHQKIGFGRPQIAISLSLQQARVAIASIGFSFILGSALFLAKQNAFQMDYSSQTALSSSECSLLLSQKEEILLAFSDSESFGQQQIKNQSSSAVSDSEIETIISELDLNEI
jgi:hypothetical protein